jgi:hypothetical protein
VFTGITIHSTNQVVISEATAKVIIEFNKEGIREFIMVTIREVVRRLITEPISQFTKVTMRFFIARVSLGDSIRTVIKSESWFIKPRYSMKQPCFTHLH